MFSIGLVTIALRGLGAREVVSWAKEAGLDALEWSGNHHVLPGDVATAENLRKWTEEAGLRIASFASYYRPGCGEDFAPVLAVAAALGAPSIRVWAGNKGAADAGEAWWDAVVADTLAAAAAAHDKGIRIAFEYHSHTLTDSAESAARLMRRVEAAGNVSLYWQPELDLNVQDNLRGLRTIAPWLSNVHAFAYREGKCIELAEWEADWREYMSVIASLPGDRDVMIEFVKDDVPEQLLRDAATLRRIVEETATGGQQR